MRGQCGDLERRPVTTPERSWVARGLERYGAEADQDWRAGSVCIHRTTAL